MKNDCIYETKLHDLKNGNKKAWLKTAVELAVGRTIIKD